MPENQNDFVRVVDAGDGVQIINTRQIVSVRKSDVGWVVTFAAGTYVSLRESEALKLFKCLGVTAETKRAPAVAVS